MAHLNIPMQVIRLPLDTPKFAQSIERYSPSGRVPVLPHGHTVVWDSLAIAEYLAEQFPSAQLWPSDSRARAKARALSAEMHAGFMALRNALPMNLRARRKVAIDAATAADIARIQSIWQECRREHAAQGPWLFGQFGIVDAMYAPIATRFVTYDVSLSAECAQYVRTVMDYPPMQEWRKLALEESEIVAADEAGTPV